MQTLAELGYTRVDLMSYIDQPSPAGSNLARGAGRGRHASAAARSVLRSLAARPDAQRLRPQSAAILRRLAELRRLSSAALHRELHPRLGALDGARDAGHAAFAGPGRHDPVRRDVSKRRRRASYPGIRNTSPANGRGWPKRSWDSRRPRSSRSSTATLQRPPESARSAGARAVTWHTRIGSNWAGPITSSAW